MVAKAGLPLDGSRIAAWRSRKWAEGAVVVYGALGAGSDLIRMSVLRMLSGSNASGAEGVAARNLLDCHDIGALACLRVMPHNGNSSASVLNRNVEYLTSHYGTQRPWVMRGNLYRPSL